MFRSTVRRLLLLPMALACMAAVAPPASALTTVPGNPLRVSVGANGTLQANLAGLPTGVFFPPANAEANAGFFLGLPDAVGALGAGTVAGPGFGPPKGATFTPRTEGAVSGAGTAASPLRQLTSYAVNDGTSDVMLVTQEVTVVNGQRRFRVLYAVTNTSGQAVRFRASTGTDLYLEGSDSGIGFFSPGPPRVVGGVSEQTGAAGGIEEDTARGPAWSRFQEARFIDVFRAIGDVAGAGLANTIDTTSQDNGVGVQWDDRYPLPAALAAGQTAQYALVWTFGSPPAKLGVTANVEPVKGTVLVSVPPGTSSSSGARASQKGRVFVPILQARQIPVGSLLDTRRGTVRLETATASAGKAQSGTFTGSLFQVLQSRSARAKGLTELRLKGASFRRCPRRTGRGSRSSAPAGAARKRTIRRLRANVRGRFRTRGRRSSATVRGTLFTVSDRCDGTLTSVKRGKVAVRDFRRRRTIIVRAGKSYLARARR